MTELRQLVVDSDPHIVALTESCLTADILDGEISLPGYNIFRGDSNRGRSGSVMVYLRDDIPPSHVVQVNSIPLLDQLWLQTKLRRTNKLLLGIIYRSPSCPASTDAMLVQHILDVVYCNPFTHLLIMGDFNLPTIGWNGQLTRTNGLGAELFISTQQHSWTQHAKEPTRFRSGQKPSLLDLIFTNESYSIDRVQHISPLGLSDHTLLKFDFLCYWHTRIVHNAQQRNFKKADFQGLRNYVAVELSLLQSGAEKAYEEFACLIKRADELFVPRIRSKELTNTRYRDLYAKNSPSLHSMRKTIANEIRRWHKQFKTRRKPLQSIFSSLPAQSPVKYSWRS